MIYLVFFIVIGFKTSLCVKKRHRYKIIHLLCLMANICKLNIEY